MNPVEMIILLLAVCFAFGLSRYKWNLSKLADETTGTRLARIQYASWWIQIMIGLGLAFGIYALLAFLCGWPFLMAHTARIVVAPGHVYTSLADMPGNVLALVLVKSGLDFAAAAVMFLLFGLYRRGILFSARNVLYIRFQGYYLIFCSIVDYQLGGVLHEMSFNTTSVVPGMLIIFVAWIMDEGRKIQEEQELTV